jgi:hypothetical protein
LEVGGKNEKCRMMIVIHNPRPGTISLRNDDTKAFCLASAVDFALFSFCGTMDDFLKQREVRLSLWPINLANHYVRGLSLSVALKKLGERRMKLEIAGNLALFYLFSFSLIFPPMGLEPTRLETLLKVFQPRGSKN